MAWHGMSICYRCRAIPDTLSAFDFNFQRTMALPTTTTTRHVETCGRDPASFLGTAGMTLPLTIFYAFLLHSTVYLRSDSLDENSDLQPSRLTSWTYPY